MTVIMNSCPPPALIHTDLKAADLEHLKVRDCYMQQPLRGCFHSFNFWIITDCLLQQCMAKRFDGSQQALDLNNIRVDPGWTFMHLSPDKISYSFWLVVGCSSNVCCSFLADLVSQNIEVTLNRRNSMLAVIKIIEENIPEVQHYICLAGLPENVNFFQKASRAYTLPF